MVYFYRNLLLAPLIAILTIGIFWPVTAFALGVQGPVDGSSGNCLDVYPSPCGITTSVQEQVIFTQATGGPLATLGQSQMDSQGNVYVF
jgi:hypothetical protein